MISFKINCFWALLHTELIPNYRVQICPAQIKH